MVEEVRCCFVIITITAVGFEFVFGFQISSQTGEKAFLVIAFS